MKSKFRSVILIGIFLLILNLLVFSISDSESYFIFALIVVIGYAAYLFDLLIKEKEISRDQYLKVELTKQKANERLLKERVERQQKVLRMYRNRLDHLTTLLGKYKNVDFEDSIILKNKLSKKLDKIKKSERSRKKK